MFKALSNERSEFLFDACSVAKGNFSSKPEIFFLAWTTTPWTLPSNLGLTVGADIEYSLIATYNPYTHLPIHVILADDLIGKFFKEEGKQENLDKYSPESKIIPWRIEASFRGKQLEECLYEQLLPLKSNAPANIQGDPFRVILEIS
jgi:isoleucyl-tRNA synthetase